MREWDGVDVSALSDVSVWGGNPVTDQARADYFDSLAYSRAVIGLNTSAFLEAAIAGRPVLAILPDEFRDNQEGTLHFGYLSTVGGGLLRTSRTLDEHREQLSQVAGGAGRAASDTSRSSTRSCARTVSTRPATPVFVDAVETLARMQPHAVKGVVAGATTIGQCDPGHAGPHQPHATVRMVVPGRGGAPRAGLARREGEGARGLPARQSRSRCAGRG